MYRTRTGPVALPSTFFARSALHAAPDLLGCTLVRRIRGRELLTGQIIETEAYGGHRDRASHAFQGPTPRNAVMFGPPGFAYVYFTYGMHWLFNVVCDAEGTPAAVLIRGVELFVGNGQKAPGHRRRSSASGLLPSTPVRLNGPAKLTKALGITGALNGEDLSTSTRLWITQPAPPREHLRILRTPRIGVDYAGPAAAWKRRFLLEE